MVNTYFRLTERKKLIEAAEIRLVSPNYASSNIESLSLPAEVTSAFHMDWDTVVFDVGGDPAGATALGRFKNDFGSYAPEQVSVYHVINVRRPMSSTADKIIALTDELAANSRLAMTGLINNTNLSTETTAEELRDGYAIVRQVAEKTGIPVAYTTGKAEALKTFLSEGHDAGYIGTPMEIDTFMHRDWDSYVKLGL